MRDLDAKIYKYHCNVSEGVIFGAGE